MNERKYYKKYYEQLRSLAHKPMRNEEVLVEIRKNPDLNNTELAKKIGVSISYLISILKKNGLYKTKYKKLRDDKKTFRIFRKSFVDTLIRLGLKPTAIAFHTKNQVEKIEKYMVMQALLEKKK